jgi:RNA polymerase sigma factor (sigma-70 family)
VSFLIESNVRVTVKFTEQTDQELMQMLVNEDLAAWSEIVKRYGNLVYSIAYQILKNNSDTEDAVQNTFIRLKLYSNKFDPTLPLKPWISRIASRVAIRLYNKKKNIHKKESSKLDPQNYTLPLQNVSEKMEQKELEQMVKKAIDLLPEISRMAVTLYYVGGMTQTEIAKELGVSQFSISEKIKSGLEKIKIYLTKSGVKVSIAVLPSFLEQSITMQSLPTSLAEKLTNAMPTKLQMASVEKESQIVGKIFFKKITTSAWFLMSSSILIIGGSYWYLSVSNKNANSATIQRNENDKIFLPVDFTNYFPVSYKPNEITREFDTPEVHFAMAQTSSQPVWKILNQNSSGQSIVRDIINRDTYDGLYLKKNYAKPQIFSGTVKMNGNYIDNRISFIMTTPTDEKKIFDPNDKNSKIDFTRLVSKVTAMQAYHGVELDFLLYIFPFKNKLISISIVHFKGRDHRSLVTKQLPYTNKCFKLGFVSDSEVEVQNMKNCELEQNWNYQKEKEILEISKELPPNFFEEIINNNTAYKIK